MGKRVPEKNHCITVNLHHDGVFIVSPFEYAFGDEKQITDIYFEGMSYVQFHEVIVKLVHGPVVTLYYCKVGTPLKLEHSGYDALDIRDQEETMVDDGNESSDAYFSSDEEELSYVDFHTEVDDNVIIKNDTTNDPFLNKLCPDSAHFLNVVDEPVFANDETVVEDSENIDPKFNVKSGVTYIRHDPNQNWKKMEHVLGMRNDWRKLIVYCGRDVETGRCAGQAILDSNPGSTCRLDDEETESGHYYFRRIYVCFKGVKEEHTSDRNLSALILRMEFVKVNRRLVGMNRVARNWNHTITPSIRKRLELLKIAQRDRMVIPSGFYELEDYETEQDEFDQEALRLTLEEEAMCKRMDEDRLKEQMIEEEEYDRKMDYYHSSNWTLKEESFDHEPYNRNVNTLDANVHTRESVAANMSDRGEIGFRLGDYEAEELGKQLAEPIVSVTPSAEPTASATHSTDKGKQVAEPQGKKKGSKRKAPAYSEEAAGNQRIIFHKNRGRSERIFNQKMKKSGFRLSKLYMSNNSKRYQSCSSSGSYQSQVPQCFPTGL
nr:hypothetical protein [Tanacetum cinerariifolium]